MSNKRVAAFSLLAHINDNNIGIKSFQDIFIPIVKSALCKMNADGIKSGQSIIEIKDQVDKIFALDIPIPILKNLLYTISNEVQQDSENQFLLHKDGAFQMNEYLFADYEEELEQRESEITEVEKIYKAYLTSNGLDPRTEPSIFDYIDLNRTNLSKFFAYSKTNQQLEIEYVHQANFINSVKANKKIYDILRRIYLGSIIAAYLEVEIGEVKNKVELLLDTNFILGLLDLNSVEATHTCRKISEICDKLGFTKSILPFTIEEIELLIERKASQLENAFFQGYLDPESIYNAAKRRNLTKTQLQQIAKNISDTLWKEYKIQTIGNDQKFRNLAKYQYAKIYDFYKNLRGDYGFSALHDTTAIAYVKEKRDKLIKGDLMKANCWFVTNTPFSLALPEHNGYLPEIIRAEDILNFLWLSNPSVTAFINSSELSSLGLTRLVSTTISYSLPSPKVLRDLDDNFNAYAGKTITADDTIMVAGMIAKKKIARPEELNKIALQSPDNFISKVKDYAEKGRQEEKEMREKLEKILERLEISFKKQQEESKHEKVQPEPVIEIPKPDLEKQSLQSANKNLRFVLFGMIIVFISILWWVFDHLISIDFLTNHPNYYLVKVSGQLLLITIGFLFFNKNYRAAWITTSVALIICIIMLSKHDSKDQPKISPNQQDSTQHK